MDEDILTAAVGLNEVEAFLIIVEFYCAPSHRVILSLTLVHLTNPRVTATRSSVHQCLEREGGRGYCKGETARLSGQMSPAVK
jgi:hypothetical protein